MFFAAIVTVVIIVVAATWFGRSRSSGSVGSLPAPHVTAPPGHVTAGQLRTYHWTTMPDAPISLRYEGVVGVWTGARMLVWGGTSADGTDHNDGASYDPSTRTWQTLPASPLTPREGAAYTWTGSKLFLWGGQSGEAARSDGAAYDPGTRSWRRLPPVSVAGHALARAVWTGRRVVLLTAAERGHQIDAHAYNPTTDSWTTLASIHIPQTDLQDISTLVTADQLYVWAPVETLSGGGLRTGNDGFVYRPGSNSWTATSLLPTEDGYSVGAALWTGDHIVFAPNGVECMCGGVAGSSTGSWADPRAGRVEPLPAWQPQPSGGSAFSWAGSAIVAVGGPAAAAWDPATRRWVRIAGPPAQGGAVQVWTGTELLIWGQLSALPSSDPSAASPPRVREPTGLELRD